MYLVRCVYVCMYERYMYSIFCMQIARYTYSRLRWTRCYRSYFESGIFGSIRPMCHTVSNALFRNTAARAFFEAVFYVLDNNLFDNTMVCLFLKSNWCSRKVLFSTIPKSLLRAIIFQKSLKNPVILILVCKIHFLFWVLK